MIKAGGGQILEGRVVLAVLYGRHGVGRPVEPDDLDVITALLGRESIGRRRDQHADSPAPAARFWLLEISPRTDRAASRRHQLQLVDVIRARRQVIASSRLRPFVAVAYHVDPSGVEDLQQLVPLTLRKLGRHAQVFCQTVHQFDFKAGHTARRLGIGVGIGAAPFHVAAVEQPPGTTNAFERVICRGGAGNCSQEKDHDERWDGATSKCRGKPDATAGSVP